MVHAYVLVRTDVGGSAGVVEAIRDFDPVNEAHIVAGDWDLVVELNAPEVYDILSTTADRIGSLAGVTDTRTYVSLED